MSGITILGGGAFGASLAVSMATSFDRINLWMRSPPKGRVVPRLPDIELPQNVSISAKLSVSEINLLAVPQQSLASVLTKFPELDGTLLVACCKGIDLNSGKGPTGVIADHCPQSEPAVLTGPSFASDIGRGLPTALTLACTDQGVGEKLQQALTTPNLRLYFSSDVRGAELGGALKNVIAIACGVAIGAGLGESARAALMTRGFAEMSRFAIAEGAHAQTLSGLSGFGDLALTCNSEKSRNFRHGLAIGKGKAPEADTTTEGVATAQAALRRAKELKIDMPITLTTAKLLTQEITPQQALNHLIARPMMKE